MREWKKGKLAKIIQLVMGQSPSGDACNNDKIGAPLLNGPTEFGDHHPFPIQFTTDPKKFAEIGDILFCVRGSTTGRMNWADQKYVIGRGIAAIRHKKGLTYQYFLKALIDYKLPQMLKTTTGSTFPNISKDQFLNLEILLPSSEDQKNISSIFSSIDNKIDLLRRQNEKLEAIAQTLFKRWFVEFEFPNKEGQPYKSSGGKMVSSELGEIPDGWRVGKIKDFGNVVCGKTPSKAIIEYFNGDIPFIKIPDMHGTVFVIDTEDTLSEKGANSQQTKFLPVYSINVSCIATVGLVTINSKASHTNQQINSIIPINEFYLEYLFFSLKSLSNYLKSLGSGGSATLNVNTNTFSNIDLLIPQKTAIKNYHNQVSAIFKKIELNAYSIINLQKIRDSLLPKLMSGQIRVTG